VKWPNDVLLEGRKGAGILVEARPQDGWAVVGIGLNVAVELGDLPPEVQEIAATMGRSPEEVDDVLAELLRSLEHRLAEPAEATVAAFRDRHIAWRDGEGEALGIDEEGSLRVRTPDGAEVTLAAGEVHLRL
jgi:BirA family biotin operon repressor/biotin-[acetyl-CoA-carboxylase] ligase